MLGPFRGAAQRRTRKPADWLRWHLDSGLLASPGRAMTSQERLPPFSHFAPRAYSASTSGPSRPGMSRLTL